MFKHQDTESGGLGPLKDHFWMAAGGTQGGSAARVPFTEPEEHTDAASKLKKHPSKLARKTPPCKKMQSWITSVNFNPTFGVAAAIP